MTDYSAWTIASAPSERPHVGAPSERLPQRERPLEERPVSQDPSGRPRLIVCSEAPPQVGGIATLLTSWLRAVPDELGPVHLLCRPGTGAGLAEQVHDRLQWSGAAIAQLPTQAYNARTIARLVRARGYREVLFFDAAARAFGLPRLRPAVPYTVYVNGSELVPRGSERVGRRLAMQIAAIRGANRVVAISQATAALLRQVTPTVDPVVAYPCFDGERVFDPARHRSDPYPQPRRLRLLTVSRLAERKGHRHVLQALQRLRDRLPPFEYTIVGDGPMRGPLEAQVQALGLQDVVRFAGGVPTETLGAYYGHADIFLMLSERARDGVEGFGLTYVEAGMSGCAVIASTHGGAVEAVGHEVAGLCVEVDAPDDIDQAILRLAADASLRKRFAEAARKRALRDLTPEAFARALLSGTHD